MMPVVYGVSRGMKRASASSVLFVALVVSACNNSTVLDPSAAAPSSTTTASANEAFPATPTQVQAGTTSVRLQVAPIVGASVEAAGPLLEALQQRARQRGITLAGSSDQRATHLLKGYFSVLTEEGQTTVIYVWDVYDPAGSRLHRISGQQKAPTVKAAEGWPGVAPAMLISIADTTIDQLSSWFGSLSTQG